jgi:hypothetical protein
MKLARPRKSDRETIVYSGEKKVWFLPQSTRFYAMIKNFPDVFKHNKIELLARCRNWTINRKLDQIVW